MRGIITIVSIVLLASIILAAPNFGNATSNQMAIATSQSSIQSLHATKMTMISSETAAQIVADSHLPGIQNDTVARTVGFDFWEYNGTIPWGNDTRPEYIVYEANPETLSVNRTHTLAFISYAGDHAFLMPKDDTSDKYVWVVRDFQSNEQYADPLHRDFYLYFVDAFSGRILAYDCACCGVCT